MQNAAGKRAKPPGYPLDARPAWQRLLRRAGDHGTRRGQHAVRVGLRNDGGDVAVGVRFGIEIVGEPQDLGVRNDRPWERLVIEGPTLLERDGTYYLFYSGGNFSSAGYAVGYATADSVSGPYEDSRDNPILVTKAPAAGPGHQSIVADKDGDLWFAYHAWDINQIGEETGGQRTMWLDELVWEDGKPIVKGPDAGPQPRP